jgi:hypothetical protein
MAFQINANTVIADSAAVSNVSAFDTTSAKSVVRALVNATTIEDGTTVRFQRTAEISKAGTGFVDVLGCGFQQSGNVNLFFEALSTSILSTSQAVIVRFRNGSSSTILTQNLTNSSYSSFNTTQTVIAGDAFLFRIQGTSTATGRMRNASVRTSSDTVYRPANSDVYFWYTLSQT